jgi:hypothetical protein
MEEAQYIRGPADAARINLEDEHELVYWTKLLGVSETKLRVAVAFAGLMASDVRDYLGLPNVQGAVAASTKSSLGGTVSGSTAPVLRQPMAVG